MGGMDHAVMEAVGKLSLCASALHNANESLGPDCGTAADGTRLDYAYCGALSVIREVIEDLTRAWDGV
ncbi:hypothetical protein [Raoultibacter timonensis]|uniref:hypothetical protein n=1 Tax=Raoultibacter timonensis TaxID=1907662 RepID=UPI0026DCA426|nr:hypothetical protein [Raoultibacter timonensis]